MKDIEINNLRNRYLLTKGATQQQVFIPLFLREDMFPITREYICPDSDSKLLIPC
jgi:hypothetical protein